MPQDQEENPDRPAAGNEGGGWAGLKEVIKRLQEQAYLFVIGLVILVILALYLPSQNVGVTLGSSGRCARTRLLCHLLG
jgi:hypothetical protein